MTRRTPAQAGLAILAVALAFLAVALAGFAGWALALMVPVVLVPLFDGDAVRVGLLPAMAVLALLFWVAVRAAPFSRVPPHWNGAVLIGGSAAGTIAFWTMFAMTWQGA